MGEYWVVIRFNHLTGKIEKFNSGSSEAQGFSDMAFDDPLLRLGVKDEYNPLLPNDYEQISKMLRDKRKLEEVIFTETMERTKYYLTDREKKMK